MDIAPPGLSQALHDALPELQRAARAAPDAFPADGIAVLRRLGVLRAVLPRALGGLGIGTEAAAADACARVLALLGEASLPLGRVYEAHLNAVKLIVRYGDHSLQARLRARLAEGALFALWVTDGDDAHTLRAARTAGGDIRLTGGKAFCSAAGYATDAVMTALTEAAAPQLIWAGIAPPAAAEPSIVRLGGMNGSATGAMRFDGLHLPAHALFGSPGDYLREPDFSTGAWRGSAVAYGGLRALTEQVRAQLLARRRDADPHQQTRFGQLLIACETARLLVRQAARRGEANDDPAAAIAYVNLARIGVERACLDGLELAQRALGLQAFLVTNPIYAIARDLAVYLRQPAPDEVLASVGQYGFAQGDAR